MRSLLDERGRNQTPYLLSGDYQSTGGATESNSTEAVNNGQVATSRHIAGIASPPRTLQIHYRNGLLTISKNGDNPLILLWYSWGGSNLRPPDPQSGALTN